MGKEKKKAPAPAHGIAAVTRRHTLEKATQQNQDWRRLNPLKAAPKVKHKSYFEAVENADKKKKKLEFKVTTNHEPPPGFEFIPTGHPELTQACKELSREGDAMFFIVSDSKHTERLDHHMNRLGCHFRNNIVDEAREVLKRQGFYEQASYVHDFRRPEPIPKTQAQMNEEADAVLRDLFPRIPHTDRQQIIDHAFKKDGLFKGSSKVGMAKELTLARRVQLAALAHIRHNHTRYDELLRESDWTNARRAVEKPCLDIIVKWRGDEETGRDQLDEILREVIEISDSEGDSEDEDSDDEDSARAPVTRARSATTMISAMAIDPVVPAQAHSPSYSPVLNTQASGSGHGTPSTPSRPRGLTKAEMKTARKTQRRFRRYAAAAEALAIIPGESVHLNSAQSAVVHGTPGRGLSRRQDLAQPVISQGIAAPAAFQTSDPGVPNIRSEYPSPLRSRMLEGDHQVIRVPDAQRPKVGPYSAIQTRPSLPLSPARFGLQDMLVQSIEPLSPRGVQHTQGIPQRVLREPHHPEEFRVISRTVIEPTVPAVRPRSPEVLVNDYDDATKRRRITTFFPGDFAPSANSHTQVNRPAQAHNESQPSLSTGYFPNRPSTVLAGPDRVVLSHSSHAFTRREMPATRVEDNSLRTRAYPIVIDREPGISSIGRGPECNSNHGRSMEAGGQNSTYGVQDGPLRSRAHPIVIYDDDDRVAPQPRRVIEIRPSHDVYRAVSPKMEDDFNGHVRQEHLFRDRAPPFSRPIHYTEVRPQQAAPHDPPQTHYQRVGDVDRYHSSRGREVVTVHQAAPGPARPNGAAGVRSSAAPQADRYAMSHDPRLYRPGDNIVYREVGPASSVPVFADQQPFPVHPARSSYVEIRGPMNQQPMSGHRDAVFAD